MYKEMSLSPKIKIMLVGPIPPPLGGIGVIIKNQVEELQKCTNVDLVVVNVASSITNILNRAWVFARSLVQIFLNLHRVNVVVLNVRAPFDLYYGLILLPFLKLGNKKLIIRKFAANFYVRYSEFSSVLRFLYNKILFKAASLWLFECKALVEAFADRISRVEWYPNHRNMDQVEESLQVKKFRCRNFVYIGHVREFKGIRELIAASERLPAGVTVDVYGPWFDDLERDIFKNRKHIHYKGILKPEEVIPTMRKYDACVLPTKARTEGHPGVILESYAAGLPIIATTCGAISEIVDESVGFLIEPDSEDAIYKAMKKMAVNDALYRTFRDNIRQKANDFSTEYWTKKYIEYCLNVTKPAEKAIKDGISIKTEKL